MAFPPGPITRAHGATACAGATTHRATPPTPCARAPMRRARRLTHRDTSTLLCALIPARCAPHPDTRANRAIASAHPPRVRARPTMRLARASKPHVRPPIVRTRPSATQNTSSVGQNTKPPTQAQRPAPQARRSATKDGTFTVQTSPPATGNRAPLIRHTQRAGQTMMPPAHAAPSAPQNAPPCLHPPRPAPDIRPSPSHDRPPALRAWYPPICITRRPLAWCDDCANSRSPRWPAVSHGRSGPGVLRVRGAARRPNNAPGDRRVHRSTSIRRRAENEAIKGPHKLPPS